MYNAGELKFSTWVFEHFGSGRSETFYSSKFFWVLYEFCYCPSGFHSFKFNPLFISFLTLSSRVECTWCSCSTGTRHPFPSFWCASSKLSPWRGSTECGTLCAMWSSWLTGPSIGFGSCRGSLSLLPFWRYVCYMYSIGWSCNIIPNAIITIVVHIHYNYSIQHGSYLQWCSVSQVGYCCRMDELHIVHVVYSSICLV